MSIYSSSSTCLPRIRHRRPHHSDGRRAVAVRDIWRARFSCRILWSCRRLSGSIRRVLTSFCVVRLSAGICTWSKEIHRVRKGCFDLFRSSPTSYPLAIGLVLSRLDYCNAFLAGLPSSALAPLQRVHAFLRSSGPRAIGPRDHKSAYQHELHWLSIWKLIQHQLCLLARQRPDWTRAGVMSRLLTATRQRSLQDRAQLVTQRWFCRSVNFGSDSCTGPSPSLPLVLGMFCRQN